MQTFTSFFSFLIYTQDHKNNNKTNTLLTVNCCRSICICICNCCNCDVGGTPRLTPDSCESSSAMGSTDSRPDGDNADSPLDELKCILERRVRGPPNVRPGMRRTPPPWRMAEGSSYCLKVKATKTKLNPS